MSCENNIVQTLKDAGHRPTPQRLMIFSAVRHSRGHVTASEVLESVKESYPYIDLSTVYRTLDMYKQMHLKSGTNLGGESYAYEWIDQTGHHHLVCKVCENITELNETFMDHLSAEIDEKFGFKSDIEHFAIFGTCEKCQ